MSKDKAEVAEKQKAAASDVDEVAFAKTTAAINSKLPPSKTLQKSNELPNTKSGVNKLTKDFEAYENELNSMPSTSVHS